MSKPARLLEITRTESITYECPQWVSDMIIQVSERWPRRLVGKFTIARAIDMIEGVLPGTRNQIKVTRAPREPAIKHKHVNRLFIYEDYATYTSPVP